MANFDIAFRRTISAEGGYVNDPDDKGGETYMVYLGRNAVGMASAYAPTDEQVRDAVDDYLEDHPEALSQSGTFCSYIFSADRPAARR